MVTALRPVYRTSGRPPYRGVEAVGPLETYRPVPGWVGPVALGAGALLLIAASAPRRGPRGRGAGARRRSQGWP